MAILIAVVNATGAARQPDTGSLELVVCGWDEVFILSFGTGIGTAPRKTWTWRGAGRADVPVEFETTVGDLKQRLDRGDVFLLDVREPREYDINRIPGSTLIPLGELGKRLDELPQGADAPDIVVHCKSGIRSAKAVNLLRDKGFTRVQNLRGGTAYLKQLLNRYDGRRDQLVRALAAYNAGPGKVDRYGGLPPYNETRAFVGRVIQRFLRLTEAQAAGISNATP